MSLVTHFAAFLRPILGYDLLVSVRCCGSVPLSLSQRNIVNPMRFV